MSFTLIESLDSLFNPGAVAVIGASDTFGKWGCDMIQRVKNSSNHRKVFVVNNRAEYVAGLPAYKTVRDIPEAVDLAVIVVPFDHLRNVVSDCVAKGAKSAVIISAGLAETGEEGAKLQSDVVQIARRSGMRLVGPNCMGHFNTGADFFTIRQGLNATPGNIGLLSQSGGFGWHILECGLQMGVGYSKFVSTGNEADLHFEDFLEYLAEDNQTRVIAGYIEGLREGKRFFDLAKKITPKKPVVIMKVGRTEPGARAAKSHTSALAGTDTIYDAAFEQSGVIRVDEVEELFDIAGALLYQPLPAGNRVGILTSGGGFGCVATDACVSRGLEIAPISQETVNKLNDILPPRWPHANPVDTVAAGFVSFSCLWPMVEDKNFDSILMVGSVGFPARILSTLNLPDYLKKTAQQFLAEKEKDEIAGLELMSQRMKQHGKPVVMTSIIDDAFKSSDTFKKISRLGMIIYPTPERAARVVSHLVRYSQYLRKTR